MLGERTAGEKVHLERADQTQSVARQNPLPGCGVDTLHHAVKKLDALRVGQQVEPPTELLVPARSREEAPRERSIIEAGSADDDWPAPACLDLWDNSRSLLRVPCGGVMFCRVGNVDEMVGYSAPLLDRYLVSPDIKTAIYSRRIATDDFTAVSFSQIERQRAFPRGGGTEDSKDGATVGLRCNRTSP